MVHADAEDAETPCERLLVRLETETLKGYGFENPYELSEEYSDLLRKDIRWQALEQLSFFRDVLEKIADKSGPISHVDDAKNMANLAREALATRKY